MPNQEIEVLCIKTCPVCDEVISDKVIKKDHHWLVEQVKLNTRIEYSANHENKECYVWHKQDGVCFSCSQQ